MVTPSKNQSGQFAFGAPGALSNSFGTPVHNVSALEPDLQVIFKGLQKRDATTRVKAVEDLVQNSGKLLEDLPEASVDPFVGAFMGLYPTLAIDVDRKVRANVHAIVGMLVRAYKKRTVRQLADCAPYWQLGLHDSDRTVSKAAADALTMAFPTSEKQTEFKKLFSVATVGRCIELALDEDASSLSDSRFVSKDDAEAKYSNTCAAALLVLTDALAHDKDRQLLVVEDTRLWRLSQSSDAIVQRAVLKLITMVVQAQRNELFTESFQSNVATLINHVSPTNTLQLCGLLYLIADNSPDTIFKNNKESKKSIPARLLKLIRNGPPPGIPTRYWSEISLLIQSVKDCSAVDSNTIETVLSAYQAGIGHAPRDQGDQARTEYINVCIALLDCAPVVVEERLLSFFSNDMQKIGHLDRYKHSLDHLSRVSQKTLTNILDALEAQALLLLGSSSESDLVVLIAWADLICALCDMPFVEDDVLSGVHHSITKALSLGKSDSTSYRYACHVMTRLPVQQSEQITKHIQELKKLMQEDSTGAFVLPRETVVLLERLHKDSFAADAEVVLEIILSSPQSHTVMSSEFISRLCTSFLGLNSEALIHWFLHDGRGTSTARMSRWKSYTTYARNNTDLGLLSKTLLPMISGADTSDPGMLEEALILLTELAHLHVDLVDKCGIKPDQLLEVIWRLGRLMDFTVLLALFRALMTQDSHQLVRALQTSVWQQVTQTSADSIPIQQLYDLFDCTHCFKMPTDVFVQDSDAALKVILPGALPKELTIVDPLGVLSHMIPKTMENFTASLTFDLQGLSTYFRICYVLKRSGNHYSDRIQMNLLIAEALLQAKRQHPAANMVTDNNLEKLDQSGLFSNWENQTSTFIDHAATILVEGGSDKESTNSMFEALGCASAVTTLHWYETSVFYRILAKAREREISAAEAETVYDLCSKDLFFHVACALALNNALFNVKGFSFQRNKIASDLTGTIQEVKSATALVKLNSHLSQDVERTTAIPRQRLILLVKNLLGYSTVHELSAFLAYEILTLLLHVLPDVASEYGSFWQSAIDVLHKVLQLDTGDISSQYSALKLAAWLWTSYESNDDLSEFWINAQPRTEILIAQSFMSIASRPRDNQASTVCSLIASRLMRKVRTSAIDHSMSTSLSALISDSAEHVQLTAYVVLSKLVDREREETILSSALAKEYEEISAAFPPELLSIALDPAIEEHDIYDHFGPLNTSQRGYFMAWVMIFRFFKDTPLRMRVKLISDLDEADLIEPLLAVIFAIMKLLDDVPADVNPYSKTELDLELVVQEGNEMLAYAAHLYYACLTHVPALVRAWWIDCKDRRLSTAVEQLTVKHYSLTLIQHDVQTLQSEQSKSVLKDDNLTVRISNGGRDIFTTYEIDEQNMEMAIRLPPNYPLRRVAVEGIQRVGVKDTVWRAWLFGSQAVLTAQNGSVLDAISLFQRNVSLHFEGVAECNICFSVLSVQDKSLPSKKCQTCKNLFHSSCLFKWFKSSSQSRCPLCRTSFAF